MQHPRSDTPASTDIGLPLCQRLQKYRQYHFIPSTPLASGKLTRMVGLTLEAEGLNLPVGAQCTVELHNGRDIDAEVVGFHNRKTFLMPIQKIEGIQPGAKVSMKQARHSLCLGEHLKGRVINGVGKALDGLGPISGESEAEFVANEINPLHREPISEILDVGIRAINGLLTVGKGQRIGLFAGSGVGKSVLLGMMTRFTTADVVVVGLIGERGREVKEFIDHTLGREGLKKSVVVAAPADDAPLMRLRASQLCTRIAEYFRDRGANVLLLMDSLTRFAQAQREIALAIGEPPATKGYPPSVFAKIPELVERAGNGDGGGGSITAFYTVLTEGDDLQDPIADASRAILDGHIVLSRKLAEEGLYPAIDIEASISRVMPNIVSAEHLGLAQSFKQLLARYRENKDLIAIGAYTKGSDPLTDLAVDLIPKLRAYIAQGITQGSVFTACKKELETLLQATQVADTAPVGTAKAAAAAATPATSNPTQAPRRASKVKRGLA